jgi:hypothetical protein
MMLDSLEINYNRRAILSNYRDLHSSRIPQFKPGLQQARHKHGVAKTSSASVSKSFLIWHPMNVNFVVITKH